MEGTRALVRLQVILNNKEWKMFVSEHEQSTETQSVPKSLFNKRAEGKYVPRRCTLLKKKENNQMPLEYPKN
jgi:hypothetical protein